MDTTTFDQLTRRFAVARNRRDLLKLLVGGVAAGIAIHDRQSQAGAQPCIVDGLDCSLDTDCCSGFCSDQSQVCFTPCVGFGESCPTGDECCLPLICVNGACGLPCAPLGDSCAVLPCCDGTCNASDICEDSVTCLEEHVPCSATSIPCCEGFTCTGGCCGGCVFACIPVGDPCQEGGTGCCGGSECVEGICEGPTAACIPPQQPCDDVLPCCLDLACIDDCCGGCCIPEGEPCETTGCCPGLVCNEFMTACVPDCGLPGQPCEVDEDCCEGGGGVALECRAGECRRCAVTGAEGACNENVPCCEPGTICNRETGECVFEVCIPKWHPCKADQECCKGLICDDKKGVCKEDDRCGGLGDHCASNADCCNGLTCFEALCDIPKGCVDEGDPCHPDVPCCDALVCDGKHCARKSTDPTKPPPAGGVSTLPNTGASRPDESNGWLEMLAAGGAAAAAASLLRRHKGESEERRIS